MAVVDASVIIAAIVPGDINHQPSLAWLVSLARSGNKFSAPALILSEITGPLSRGHNRPVYAKKFVQTLMTAPFANFHPVTLSLAKRAAVIAADFKIRGCDSIYVALAEALNEDLITWDKQQRERAKSLIKTYHP